MLIKVRMARGGYMELEADGHVYSDSDGAGQKFTCCDDFSLSWLGGGEVAAKNVADMDAAMETYIEAVKGGARWAKAEWQMSQMED